MTGVLTWRQLRDLKLAELQEAADGWGAVSNLADAARDRISNEMVNAIEKTQKGEAAGSAADRLKRLDRNYDYLHTECGLVRTTVNSLAYELAGPQRKLKDALDDAAALRFTVGEDGSVSYPAGGENLISKQPVPGGSATGGSALLARPPSLTGLQPGLTTANPNHAKAQAIADQILAAVRDAREIDARFSTTLEKLKAPDGLSMGTSTWEDAAADAAAVREVAREYLKNDIPLDKSPAQRKAWWTYLTQEQREEFLTTYPDVIGNLDGIPSLVRDEANRENLQLLIGRLSGDDSAPAQAKLGGLLSIQQQLRADPEPNVPPMYLLGIGDQGNGRAIVSFGDPDTSRNVSAYVPGLGTSLDADFARGDIKRARMTAKGAGFYDKSSASIVWLGYDAPQLPAERIADNLGVMSPRDAVVGAPAYNQFMAGIAATNENADPHITAIGHSYGSLTVGQAAQRTGGIPGADDIILVGSPGTGAHTADQLGVGKDHVYVGAAKNDIVTKLPNQVEGATAMEGFKAGFRSGSAQGIVPGLASGLLGAFTGHEVGDAVTDESQIYFGTDPASAEFGAKRFAVADGPPVVDAEHLSFGDLGAHSNYFDPEKDTDSADNIAMIVTGRASQISTQEPR
ncbi:hypothetical protein A8W25_17010 [Streptomyces sp. ERV7]|uniref:alpha/beta hydrolase n=1 Tax=Streptomyces sp. ERV7 TaxID=1322334 RepID=UPI0007F42D79|nr:alpha/beta hydrolase [Streptomyces sp. ERV7]OAR24148.1 hypothetical protein A8W25_17010 [Streptomyces sp. ERV7]